MKKAVLIQPGKLGDVLLSAPMAKYYSDQGLEIHWPILSNFESMVQRFDYVTARSFDIGLDDYNYYSNKRTGFFNKRTTCGERSAQFFNEVYKTYSRTQYRFIDPCFAFPGHQPSPGSPEVIQQWLESGRSWVGLKYHLAEVPLRERWNLQYERNEQKEEALLELIKKYAYKKYKSDNFSIVHTYTGGNLPTYTGPNPIQFGFIKGYEIVDWLKVLENATEIVCVDSCLCHFVEVSPSLNKIKKTYLGTEEKHYTPFMDNILFNNWNNLSPSNLSYGNKTLETI